MRSTTLLLFTLACQSPISDTAQAADEPVDATHFVLAGGTVVGVGLADVEVRDGQIVAVGEVGEAPTVVEVAGKWLAPAFIDAHVHYAYDPRVSAMLDGGVAGGVDWAAPEGAIDRDLGPMHARWSGPMITAIGGYPTTGWGSQGYGLECADAAAAAAAVGRLADAGADVIKVPLDGSVVLDDDAVQSAIDAAHARGLKVGVHALSAESAARGGRLGADVLVHMPGDVLPDEVIAAYEAVIPTMSAFGGGSSRDNVRRFREAGKAVFYGTDFGNARTTGISAREVETMVEAGMDGAAILHAGTSGPAAYFGFESLGAIAPGKAASLLVLGADPLAQPGTLASPESVYIDGSRR